MREDSPEIYEFFGGREHCDKAVFDNPLRYDEDRFVERYLSSSYSLREGEPGYEECIQRVREVQDMMVAFGRGADDHLRRLPGRRECPLAFGGMHLAQVVVLPPILTFLSTA